MVAKKRAELVSDTTAREDVVVAYEIAANTGPAVKKPKKRKRRSAKTPDVNPVSGISKEEAALFPQLPVGKIPFSIAMLIETAKVTKRKIRHTHIRAWFAVSGEAFSSRGHTAYMLPKLGVWVDVKDAV